MQSMLADAEGVADVGESALSPPPLQLASVVRRSAAVAAVVRTRMRAPKVGRSDTVDHMRPYGARLSPGRNGARGRRMVPREVP